MKTYYYTLLVPMTVTVDGESESDARSRLLSLKRYSITNPDGERVDLREEDIQMVQTEDGEVE